MSRTTTTVAGAGSTVSASAEFQPRKAYSYVRFSSPKQREGDSLRRQTEKAAKYASDNGLELDTELNLHDLSVSAFRGDNAKTGKLSAFLKAVDDGSVPPGSFLLIENIDRLTRDDILEASELFLGIIRRGIVVVTLTNGMSYSRAELKDTPHLMMMIVLELIRANLESARKAQLSADNYRQKRVVAAQSGAGSKPFTRMLPAWLRFNTDTKMIEADTARAEVVGTIFEKASEGWGQHRIAHWLNESGVPTFGGVGAQRRAQMWNRSYVKKLLSNRAVIGTFTPQQRTEDGSGKRKRKPLEAIEGYFPAIIDRDVFERVASRMKATAARGRNASAEPASIFAGVLQCARCGGVATRVAKGAHVYLVCSKAHRKSGCKYLAVPYKDVEKAFRRNARAIIKDAPRGKGAEEIDAAIANLEGAVDVIADRARETAEEYVATKSEALRRLLGEREAELEKAKEELRALRVKRNTEVAPFVYRRLAYLWETLRRKPFNVAEVNKALKEAVSKIVLDPEIGRLAIYWHHATEPSEGVPFFSRHSRAFSGDAQGDNKQ